MVRVPSSVRAETRVSTETPVAPCSGVVIHLTRGVVGVGVGVAVEVVPLVRAPWSAAVTGASPEQAVTPSRPTTAIAATNVWRTDRMVNPRVSPQDLPVPRPR